MGKLKAIGSTLTRLKPTMGSLAPVERNADADRRFFKPWRKWYKSARWQALRITVFIRDLYTCQWPGCGFTSADTSRLVADHCEPHRGDERLFWLLANLQTLCKPCHDSRKQRAERSALR
ncbi:HNH endonuclease [Sphingomonas sp. PP-CE-1A-559]|uniref:HNH endonuclease n=1 Tax=Sphingomonas sp. PP-CE-1A-559 TaxID=2135657 RepID=UPI0010EB8FA4|nr:HNH endonuclease [Sphingomonas sp. PP-CE-1A-559]TCP94461.1 HNH endonuclease [Sphingomonas sp. PP-CE-1A-559]